MFRSVVRPALRRGRSVLAVASLCLALGGPALAQGASQPPAPPPAQEGFEQVTGVPPSEQLPATPLVIGAYAFVWVVLVGYIWSVARRLSKVQEELDRLDAQLTKGR